MPRPTGWLIVVVLTLAPCGRVAAQTPQTPAVEKPAANPPPPLFPKHRRGLYVNSEKVEVIDATPQSPPLETDDPSVPDAGEYRSIS